MCKLRSRNSGCGCQHACASRAEATDVANAVLDGVDGILLGAETLRGKYPVQTVQTILAICRQAEKAFDHNYHFEHLMSVSTLHPFPSSELTPFLRLVKSMKRACT